MATLPNPLTNIANASPLVSRAERWSRRRQTEDPQLGRLLDQRMQERFVLNFLLRALEKRASGASQDFLAIQPPQKITETREARQHESAEMRWLVENRHALETFRGEWVLIYNDMLVVHSTDFGEIRRAIADRDIRSPFVYYVPTEEESNFIAF